MLACAANVTLGLFFIGVELVTPSPPGRSAVPVGLAFITFGAVVWFILRYALRKRAADAEAMPEQLERRARLVDDHLAQHGTLVFDARPAAEARARAIGLALLGGLILGLLDYALAHKRGIDIGWVRALYLLMPVAGWFLYPLIRGARFELTQTTLSRSLEHRRESIAFDSVSAVHNELTRVVRAGSIVGFYVKLTLEAGAVRMSLADLLAARPPNSRGPYQETLTVGDVLCWLWLRRGPDLGLKRLTA